MSARSELAVRAMVVRTINTTLPGKMQVNLRERYLRLSGTMLYSLTETGIDSLGYYVGNQAGHHQAHAPAPARTGLCPPPLPLD